MNSATNDLIKELARDLDDVTYIVNEDTIEVACMSWSRNGEPEFEFDTDDMEFTVREPGNWKWFDVDLLKDGIDQLLEEHSGGFKAYQIRKAIGEILAGTVVMGVTPSGLDARDTNQIADQLIAALCSISETDAIAATRMNDLPVMYSETGDPVDQ